MGSNGNGHLHSQRIFIIDDDPACVEMLSRLLARHGYTNVHATTDSRRAVVQCHRFNPDLVLLDLRMPDVDGYAVLSRLREHPGPEEFVPIMVLSADVLRESKQKALELGANDFVTKPFDSKELVLRIRNQLATRRLYLESANRYAALEGRVRERTRALTQAQMEIIDRLGTAAEFRDSGTARHTQRVGEISALIAEQLPVDQEQISLLRRAAALHDVGKIGIPDTILMKPGKLTSEEFEVVKQHTVIGSRILGGSENPLLQAAEVIARSHHENWDGTGYPFGLHEDEIPLFGRIVAVADVFDALISTRCYKEAWDSHSAIDEILIQKQRKFDPAVVEAFHETVLNGTLHALVEITRD